jgi:hypothetical protein
MEEIERAIPVGKLALYYAAARDVGLQEVLEKHFPSKSFPFLVLYKVHIFIATIQKLLINSSISKILFNVPHQHAVLTISDVLWSAVK